MKELTYDFIYEDYEILKKQNCGDYYSTIYPIQVQKSKSIIRKLVKRLLNFKEIVTLSRKNKEMIFFEEADRFSYFSSVLAKEYKILTFSRLSSIGKNKEYLHFFPIDFEEKLYNGLLLKDLSYANSVAKQIIELFKQLDIKVIFLGCDRLFLERILVYVARKLDIPVVVFQHGVYFPEEFEIDQIGLYSNECWWWSDYIMEGFYRYHPDSGIKSRLMGYPFKLISWKPPLKKRVLFIGTGYKVKESTDRFNLMAQNVFTACEKMELNVVYRPHHSESIEYLKNQNKGVPNFRLSEFSDLFDDILQSSIVVGDISSVMSEAAIMGCPVLQISWNDDIEEKLNNEMYSFSLKSVNEIEAITEAIEQLLDTNKSFFIDQYYMYRNKSFQSDVLKWTNEIINLKLR